MLSLASNISSTQAVESKYSADFDGTDDFIDTGHHFSDVFNDSFTISFWAKPDDGQPASTQYFFGENDSDDDILRGQLETDGDFRLLLEGNTDTGSFRTNSPVFSNGAATSWTHILVSVTKPGSGNSSAVIYINGSSVAITTSNIAHDDHALFSSAQNLAIGARNNKGTIMSFYSGGMDEWALWNVALDADAAAAIYNGGSPLNLKFNQGNYDNSSALQAYYKMGDGSFDDKANGVVHDQDNPGFGSELVTNGDFSTGGVLTSTSWSLGWISSDNDGTNISGGVFNLINDAGGGFDGRATATNGIDAKISLSDNAMYVVTYTISENASNASLNFYFGEFTGGQPNTVGTHTVFHRHNPAGSSDFIVRNATNDTTIKFSNILLKKLNGNPGLTSGGVTFSSDTP